MCNVQKKSENEEGFRELADRMTRLQPTLLKMQDGKGASEAMNHSLESLEEWVCPNICYL
jgi:hypothetical protein